MRKKLRLVIITQLLCLVGFAQETKTPLKANKHLEGHVFQYGPGEAMVQKSPGFSKAAEGTFPFIERFIYSGSLKDSFWLDKDATKSGRTAVFDAKNAAGAVYPGGAFGECDKLTSRTIDLYRSRGQLYAYFSFSTGSTWQSGDSLVLQLRTSGGNYRSVWSSPGIVTSNEEVVLSFPDLTDYIAVNFQFRFVNYSSRIAGNTENFLLHFVSFADKWPLPGRENFTSFDTPGVALVSPVLWMQRQATVARGLPVNAAVFDGRDEAGVLYNNGIGSGYADTLMSHLINIPQYNIEDSVYLSFFYEGTISTKNTDSLIVEFRNNTGAWVRVFQDAGTAAVKKRFSQQVNAGRFRHAAFQFRLIGRNGYSASDSSQLRLYSVSIGTRLGLPFLEDFSTSSVYPDQRKWQTRHTYINNNFPIRPPSINVATFDALDSRGVPYGYGRGYCDTLTSQELSLSGLTVADSVYLSFFFQAGGHGEAPNSADSLILEFRNDPLQPDRFVNVWGTVIGSLSVAAFTRVDVLVRDSAFFHDAFQFRFKNLSNQAGNINHWHIDYIRMARGRTKGDDYYDLAVNATSGSLLTPYVSMPYRHFLTNPAGFTKKQQSIGFKSNLATPLPTDFYRNVYDPTGTMIDTAGNFIPFFPGLADSVVRINDAISITTPVTPDSIIINTRYGGRFQGTLDNIPFNDSVTVPTIFSNYFAYDDGTAEQGYVLKNTGGSVALGFTLSVPDTLEGIAMFFNRSRTDVSGLPFNLMVWKSISQNSNGTGETVLKRIPFGDGPVYTDKINGFYYFRFPTRLPLPAGRFYIGWEQASSFFLNIGIDENFLSATGSAINPNMFYKIDDIWFKTAETGGLMMRPLLGKWLTPPVGVQELVKHAKLDILVYPNPAAEQLTVKTSGRFPLNITIFDLSGRSLMQRSAEEESITLPQLTDGLYIINITDADGVSGVKKLMIKN